MAATKKSEAMKEAEEWVAKVKPCAGVECTGLPLGLDLYRLMEDAENNDRVTLQPDGDEKVAAVAEALAGMGLEIAGFCGPMEPVFVPTAGSDPTAAAALKEALEEHSAAAAAGFVDRLREHHGAEPCAHLREWAAKLAARESDGAVGAVVERAQREVIERLPPGKANRLRQLAGLINREHELAVKAEREALEHACLAGEYLTEFKGLVGHGNWLRWLRANVKCSVRTAQAYMFIYRHRDELPKAQRVALLGVRYALAYLARKRDGDGEDGDGCDDYYPGDPDFVGPTDVPALMETASPETRAQYQKAVEAREERHREADRLRGEADVERGQRYRETMAREEEERRAEHERSFNLDVARTELRETLERVRGRWPESRRADFPRVAREEIDGMA
jgi:hypothetical protein